MNPNNDEPKICAEKFVKEYSYKNEAGEIAYKVCRRNNKSFAVIRPDKETGNWLYGLDGIPKLLYKLPELIASPIKKSIYICEGEEDVNTLTKLGFTATTNSGGSGNWNSGFNKYFSGRPVYLMEDNDEAGRSHVKELSEELHGITTAIKIIRFTELNAN